MDWDSGGIPQSCARESATCLEEVLAGLHVSLEGEADAYDKGEVQQHDEPVD
jgi:hypothetical protein